jgi:hypothetical protein
MILHVYLTKAYFEILADLLLSYNSKGLKRVSAWYGIYLQTHGLRFWFVLISFVTFAY